jgi:hypothetical protein
LRRSAVPRGGPQQPDDDFDDFFNAVTAPSASTAAVTQQYSPADGTRRPPLELVVVRSERRVEPKQVSEAATSRNNPTTTLTTFSTL